MAKYTITLKELIQRGYNVFDDSWVTFDPDHKKELCEKILRHYWFCEIGQETPDRFKHYLNEHLSVIMPYYNRLYQSELLEIEPLYNQFLEDNLGLKKELTRNRKLGTRRDESALKEMADSIKRLTTGTSNLIGNQNTVGHETWSEDKTIHTTEVTDQDTTEHTDETTDFTENVKDVTNEVMKDINDGTKQTDGTSHTTTSNTRRYSDTPQARINDSQMSIERQYLTNYTSENGTSDTNTHSDEVIHNQEDRTTDTTETKDTTAKTVTEKDVKGTNDITVNTDTIENVHGQRDTTKKFDQTEDIRTTGTEKGFSNGSQTDRRSVTGFDDEDHKEEQSSDITRTTKGYSVSQSELLEAYRKTFINIDQMIIEELAIDFMGIF